MPPTYLQFPLTLDKLCCLDALESGSLESDALESGKSAVSPNYLTLT